MGLAVTAHPASVAGAPAADAARPDMESDLDLLSWPLALLFIATGSVSLWAGLWAAGAWLFAF